jgi:DNA repair protein SbcD/Mre11
MAMAVRLLHAADIHIGMENYGKLNPQTGLSTRLEDFCATFDEAVDRAIAEPVDLVVLAGDIYKTRDPTPTHQREFAARIRRLIDAGIPIFIVPGNHDIPLSSSRATSVDVFRTLELPGVTVARAIGRWTLQTKAGPIQALALPWLTRSQVLTREDYKNKTIEELNMAMVELAVQKLHELAAELDPAIPSILVGHAHVYGARVGAERLLLMGIDPLLDCSALTSLPNLDYIALGHIHKHQALSVAHPPVVYPGSINRVDFSEEDEEKGFVLASVERGSTTWEFVPVHARPFLTIEARAEGENPTDDVVKAIFRAGQKVRESVVRLRIKTTRAAATRLNEDEIRAQLREAFYLLPIQRELLDLDRERAGGRDFQGKTPLELLQIYLEGKDLPADRRETLLKHARDLMAEPADAPAR